MIGNEKVLAVLNQAAKLELQGITGYIIHRAMQENFGFGKLANDITFKHAKDEMRHLDGYIDRILFLEGTPDLSNPLPVKVGKNVAQQIEHDLEGEYNAIQSYAEFAKLCEKEGDIGTRDLFQSVLTDEEGHANTLETQLSIITKIGIENYLNRQIPE